MEAARLTLGMPFIVEDGVKMTYGLPDHLNLRTISQYHKYPSFSSPHSIPTPTDPEPKKGLEPGSTEPVSRYSATLSASTSQVQG